MAIRAEAWKTIRAEVTMRNDIWEDLDMSLHLKRHKLHVAMSTYRSATISARSANAPIKAFYKRTLGQPRVYLLHKRWFSLVFSIALVHIAFVFWLILKPLSFIGQSISTRPRPEQY